MIKGVQKAEYYRALVEKNTEYEGLFFVGVTTTGIFCRPTCPTRTPRFENCEFFEIAQQALEANFRPCKRCQPLSHPYQVSELVTMLVKAVEENPEKRWKETDFQELGTHSSTVLRQFKKRFGMTFVEYIRARRMGIAIKQIKAGEAIIQAQLSAGYESSSGFREAFSRLIGAAPSLGGEACVIKASWLDTPLGPMIVLADNDVLYLFEFIDRRGLEREIEQLKKYIKAVILPGDTPLIRVIAEELAGYFKGLKYEFNTPVRLLGSTFQKLVWEELRKIPFGETRSYSQIAEALGKPSAVRAVATAVGLNRFALIIPCHRVIYAQGGCANYSAGPTRKKWLIQHEAQRKK